MSDVVLDASALLALVNGEAGSDRVAQRLPGARISAVNHSEVVAKLAEAGMPEEAVRAVLDGLGITVVPFDSDLSFRAGLLRPVTRRQGLSLGDRSCLALALELSLPVLTTDRSWRKLDLPLEVEVIR